MLHRTPVHTVLALTLTIATAHLASCGMSHVYVESEGLIEVPAEQVRTVHGKLQNGDFEVRGTPAKLEFLTIRYRVKAGGFDLPDAEACLGDIELLHSTTPDGRLDLGWRYAVPKRSTWAASVNFSIEQPESAPVTVETHNGGVDIRGVRAACTAKAHNGSIRIEDCEERVVAESHNGNVAIDGASTVDASSYNGRLRIRSSASKLNLSTHNGGITAELDNPTRVGATIATHNGPISIEIRGGCPVEVEAKGVNGSLRMSGAFEEAHEAKNDAWAKKGTGGDTIRITTYNGSVHVKAHE